MEYCLFTEIRSLQEENTQLKEQVMCKICMDKNVSIAFLPCGHLACCIDCAPAMRKCPMCRVYIKGTVKTYLAWILLETFIKECLNKSLKIFFWNIWIVYKKKYLLICSPYVDSCKLYWNCEMFIWLVLNNTSLKKLFWF